MRCLRDVPDWAPLLVWQHLVPAPPRLPAVHGELHGVAADTDGNVVLIAVVDARPGLQLGPRHGEERPARPQPQPHRPHLLQQSGLLLPTGEPQRNQNLVRPVLKIKKYFSLVSRSETENTVHHLHGPVFWT